MNELLIPILAFFSVMSIGGIVLVLRGNKRRSLEARLSQFEGAYSDESAAGGAQNVGAGMGFLQGLGRRMGGGSALLKSDLAKAGFHSAYAAEIFLGAKAVLLIFGLIGMSVLILSLEMSTPMTVLSIVGGAVMLSFLPNMFVSSRRSARRQEIEQTLPDAIDLLEISVSAGMGVDQAWNAASDEIRRVSDVLADEMALTNLEIHLGTQRAVAMKHMADRTDAAELGSLASILMQSEKFGTSVGEALRTFATTMREARSQRAEESAEKMAVKLLIPMVIFIFPAVLVVSAGPAAIKLTELFGS